MWCRRIPRIALLAAIVGMAASLVVLAQDSNHRGRKYKAPPPTSHVVVTILRKDDGKPIENASVIFHIVGDKGNMELKTNEDGESVIDVLPTHSEVLLQVIAKGYETYGEDYKLDKPTLAIQVKLHRPVPEYSIYTEHNQAADAGKSTDKGKTPDAGKDTAPKTDSPKADNSKNSTSKDASSKDASKDKSGESAKKDDSQPAGQPQPQ